MLDIPVAFIVFNRPDLTAESFEPIRRAKPKVLYIISDGARATEVGEAERVDASRRIAESVDWPCQIERIYSETNLGCGKRISSGIDEVFAKHDRAIILEDDCVADDSFFRYCETLLDYYADDQRIAAISGDHFHGGRTFGDGSYFFSKYAHCWGWATWRRAWQHQPTVIERWPAYRDSGDLNAYCDSVVELDYWTRTFDSVYRGEIDTWDFTWLLACWMESRLTILPNKNLVTNIGFGEGATHTTKSSPIANLPRYEFGPIEHPSHVSRSYRADRSTDWVQFSRGKVKFRHLVQLARRWRAKSSGA